MFDGGTHGEGRDQVAMAAAAAALVVMHTCVFDRQ